MRATVVIPCYKPDANFEKMLGDLNAQTSQEFLVLLADDGNHPPLAPRVARTLERPFEIIRFNQNQGIVAGLNACIARASTQYVIRMDADDRMPPDRISRQINFLDENPGVDIMGANMVVFGSKVRYWAHPCSMPFIHAGLLWGPTLNHPTVAAKTSVMQRFPYPEGHPLGEDYALWVSLAANGVKMANAPFVGVFYRLSGQNTSQTTSFDRANRYMKLHQHAIQTLFCDVDTSSLTPGLQNGAHLALAGIKNGPHAPKPSWKNIEKHATMMLAALGEIKSTAQDCEWVDVAISDTKARLIRAKTNRRYGQLTDIWRLCLMTVADWKFLLLRCR